MSDNEEISDEKPKFSTRAERNGIGALLATLRSTQLANTSNAETSEEPQEATMRPLNRKEKRALLNSKKQEESQICASTAGITAIPTNLRLYYSDEASYEHFQATFGYQSSRKNNYVHLVSQNDTSTVAVTGAQDRFIRTYKMSEETITPGWKRNTGGLIQDMCWEKTNGNFFSSSKFRPIQLWNIDTGSLMESYSGKDSGDNIKEASSIGQFQGFLVGGFRNRFQLWDVQIGGDAISTITYFDRDYNTGMTGYSMSIENHPTMGDLFASAGTSSRVCIFSMNWKNAVTTIEGSARGYTHVKFSPDGLKIYASERSGDIHCFDTRMNALVQVLKREMSTAHRTRFDIEETGRLLYTGSSSGNVLIYDLTDYNEESSPVLTVNASSSCVPCVSLKNKKLAICTGQRDFHGCSLSSDEDEESPKNYIKSSNSFQLFDIE